MKSLKMLLCVVFAGCFSAISAQEKIYRPSGFSAVDISTKIKARLVPSHENKVVVTGSRIDDIVVEEKKGSLNVRFKSTKGINADPVPLTIYYASPLTYIGASGDSEITVDQALDAKKIRIDAGKGAFVKAAVSADTLYASIAAGGQIQVNGDADYLNVNIKTGGQFNGYELVAEEADANISAGGTIYLYATQNTRARVFSGGKIYCKGPAKVDSRTTMGGTVIIDGK